MFGNQRRWSAAAMVGGLAAFVALAGCGKEPSVASKSEAAFKEAKKRGETPWGGAHGHGALTPGEGHEMPGNAPESGSAADHAAIGQGRMDHSGMAMGGEEQGSMGHEGMNHGAMAQGGKDHAAMRQVGMDHSGMAVGGKDHGAMAQGTMDHGAMGHEGMGRSGMGMGGMDPAEPAPVAASPGQPAATLRPDVLDAPAATSVTDAQRSAEMAEEMAGGMTGGGHGAGTYRQVDAGRGPGAYQGSEPQTSGPGPHQHGGSATLPPSGQEGDHSRHEPPGGENAAASYVCPMHREVTSETPGKCPKCGMTLVQRRKE